ncbi:MAG TPA: 2-amino-4-hydroxy-6-hydroxymethyldihydropteridine diphosphokinase [Pseudomonadales bacterium]
MTSMVLIGLGSNRGDSIAIVREAFVRLETFACEPVRRSSLWRTSPVDCPPGSAEFINAAAAFVARPEVTPESLLAGLKRLEGEFGRPRVRQRNAPRELDLDLLLFGDERRNAPDFVLPHPRAMNRRFVLAPAAEVLPEQVWPGTGRTIAELLAALESDEQVERLGGSASRPDSRDHAAP